jgi:hypothetical protein
MAVSLRGRPKTEHHHNPYNPFPEPRKSPPNFPGPLEGAHNVCRASLHKRGARRPRSETFDEGQISSSIPSISLETQDL